MSEEILQSITEHAELQFNPEEIELILEIPRGSLLQAVLKQEGKPYEAYLTGTLRGEAALRKSIFTMAKSGSTPAQKQYLALIEKREKQLKRLTR